MSAVSPGLHYAVNCVPVVSPPCDRFPGSLWVSYAVGMVHHFLAIERYSRVCLVWVRWKAASHSWDKKLVFVQIASYNADRNTIVLEKRLASPGLEPVLLAGMLAKVAMIVLTVLVAPT